MLNRFYAVLDSPSKNGMVRCRSVLAVAGRFDPGSVIPLDRSAAD
jgi:hypothetical protein